MTSTIKVNNIQNQCGQNIINESSNTITLGASGDTIALASGASQTGFGRTGTVDWVTTIQTSSPFTAVSGKGYFINTTSGAITMNLPSSPSAGDIVSFKDYARTFGSNALTVGRGGSNMDGTAADTVFALSGSSGTLIYMDSTKGWSLINNDTTSVTGAAFVTATGGTITTSGDYKIHTFTGPGTFCVSNGGNSGGSNTVDYLVIAGGSAGGFDRGGGGGAGGYRESSGAASGCYSVSPLGACVSALPVSAQGYPITVGAGGAVSNSGNTPLSPASDSVFSTITSKGGGAAGNPGSGNSTGSPGGSGGGARDGGGAGGTGNSPPVSPAQGTDGGEAPTNQSGPGGGGGGATQGGFDGSNNPSQPTMGDGGAGATSSINGTPTTRAGGGGSGGGGSIPAGGVGGAGGGGNGANQPAGPQQPSAGTANTGGGGGAGNGGPSQCGQAGGSGIVIIRYKYQ